MLQNPYILALVHCDDTYWEGFVAMTLKSLCNRCREFPLEKLFFGPYERGESSESLELKSLQDLWTPKTCIFCGLVKEVIRKFYGEDYIEARFREGYYEDVVLYRTPLDVSVDALNGSGTDNVACYLELGFRTPDHLLGKQPGLYRQDRIATDGFDQSWVLPSIFSISTTTDSKLHAHPGRFLNHDKIDWSLVRRWISTCVSHSDREPQRIQPYTVQERDRSYMRVINVDSANVIPFPQDTPYVALSYQWGADQKLKLKKDNLTLLQTPDFFNTPDGQPTQTILDAMAVTRQLGHKYLWVDALCIIQDDMQSITRNVDSMDLVYQDAVLTIVAAAGNNAYHGLPGVSTTQRTEGQMRAEIGPVIVANMLENANGAINFTRWNTRGWTFQEKLLSKRLLTFTNSQVYYHCDWGCDYQEQYHLSDLKVKYTFADPRARIDLEDRNLWDVYAITVAEYTKRSITDPMDKLRAVNGIFNYLKQPFRGPFFFGLPISLFDVALLWRPLGTCERGSRAFPSWSWAGWNGAMMYELVDSMNNMCECILSQAEITPRTSKTQLCANIQSEAKVPPISYDASKWCRNFDEETLEIGYASLEPEFSRYRYPRPLSFVEEGVEEVLSCQKSTLLQISANVAKFRLTDQHSFEADPLRRHKQNCKQGNHELCYLAILDIQNRIAGTILVDARIVPQIRDKQHRFLALSRSSLYRIDEDPSWDEATKTFRHWSRQKSKFGRDIDPSIYATSNMARDDREPNDAFFDKRYFSEYVWWPTMNVLLLSEEKDSVVERLGIGKIHIDAFEPIAVLEEVLLG